MAETIGLLLITGVEFVATGVEVGVWSYSAAATVTGASYAAGVGAGATIFTGLTVAGVEGEAAIVEAPAGELAP